MKKKPSEHKGLLIEGQKILSQGGCMANDCYNSITVSGNKSHLRMFYSLYVSQENGVEDFLDFDKVIPLPDRLPLGSDNWDILTCRAWGTPGNSYDTQICFENDCLNVNYYTEWTPCNLIIEALIARHPELSFDFYYEERSMNISGKILGTDGRITFEEHGEYQSDADEEDEDEGEE
jgi:hypothetical protein